MSHPDPTRLLETAVAFWPSKVLLTAVELDLFTLLAERPLNAGELEEKLQLRSRATRDFLDALVALKFLERDGDGPGGRYRNTAETAAFLSRGSPAYIGGFMAMLNTRLFGFWNSLGEALHTGKAQNEVKTLGKPVFESLYADPQRLDGFLQAMSGIQVGNFTVLAEKFDFSRYHTLTDVGGALALLSRIVAARHPHLLCTSFDLPPVAPLAQAQVDSAGLADRVRVVGGDFFQQEIPRADVITMGNILHDWNLATKKMLIVKAFQALPAGGAFIAIENLIDDARRENAFGLMMSLNMLIETGDGFDYTGADFRQWCGEAGFSRFEQVPLAGPATASIAYK
jgi:hypothetical protein